MLTLDDEQKEIIPLRGEALVLAPPGCGKTQVLTERVRYAHSLFPHLRQYTLKSILQTFHLEGEN